MRSFAINIGLMLLLVIPVVFLQGGKKSSLDMFMASLPEAQETSYVPRGMFVLLDDDESNLGPSHQTLFVMLAQKPGPIIVSTALLKKVLSEYNNPSNMTNAAMEKAYGTLWLKGPEEAYTLGKQILLRACAFNVSEWIIKKVNESLTLLVPRDYLDKNSIDVDQVKNRDTSLGSGISSAESSLGLKVNHMELITSVDDLINSTITPYKYADYFEPALSSIFCTHADYVGMKGSPLPLWALCMIGHGETMKSIVGLQLHDFPNVLDFLHYKINLRLLLYISCYAAGLNIEKIYKQDHAIIQKTYSFPIITQVFTDTPAAAWLLTLKIENNVLKLETGWNSKDLFEQMTTPEMINYERAIAHVFPIIPTPMSVKGQKKSSEERIQWENIPQIKLPGVEWFSAMGIRTELPLEKGKPVLRPAMVQIGSTLAKTRDSNNALDVVQFFKTDPKVIMLYAADIPFELKVGKELNVIASMLPGNTTHKIKKISSNELGLSQILSCFMALEMLDTEKIFFIEAVEGKTGVISDVIVRNRKISKKLQEDTYERYAIFLRNGKLNIVDIEAKNVTPEVLVDEAKRDFYNKTLAQIKGTLAPLGGFEVSEDFGSVLSPSLDRISTPSSIEEIKAPDNDSKTNIRYALGYIRQILDSGAFVLIKKMSGVSNDLDLGIAKKITIENVIVDNDKSLIFFTYDKKFYRYNYSSKDAKTIPNNYMDSYQGGEKQKEAIETTGSLLPSSITAEGIEKIRAILPRLKQKIKEAQDKAGKSQVTITSPQKKLEVARGADSKPSATIKASLVSLGMYDVNEASRHLFFPELDTIPTSSFIEEIKVDQDDPMTRVRHIIGYMRLILSPSVFIWIKKMSGASDDLGLGLPEKMLKGYYRGDRVIIENVIIDPDNIFFTYNNTFYHYDFDAKKAKTISDNYMNKYIGGSGQTATTGPLQKQLEAIKAKLEALKINQTKLKNSLGMFKKKFRAMSE